MIVLGIESTCDETAVSFVENGKKVLANAVTSQIQDHLPWQGVVPEIASRLHLTKIIPLVKEACIQASLSLDDADIFAACNRPGLVGGLIVGTATAKAFAWAKEKPFVAINHMEAHAYSPHLTYDIPFPYIGLLASGGHTMLLIVRSHTEYEVIGTTIDDAIGEAFDKLAKHYDMGYPGGPNVEKLALAGDEKAFNFPISNLYKSNRKYDISYSGIKTAAINFLPNYITKENWTINDLAASFQKRAFDMLIKKIELASQDYSINRVVVAGGVSANQYFKQALQKNPSLEIYFPDLRYATDNAAMVAGYAFHVYNTYGASSLSEGVHPRVQGYKVTLQEQQCR